MSKILNCQYCLKEFKYKQGLQRHLEKCPEKETFDKIDQIEKNGENKVLEVKYEYENKILEIKNHYEKLLQLQVQKYENQIKDIKAENDVETSSIIHDYEIRIAKLESTIEIMEKRCYDLKDELEKRSNSVDELAKKAIENAGTKNTNITNNKNQIYNALQVLSDEHMRDQVKYLTFNNVKNGANGIAHFASNYTFKDRVYCSDMSRLNFVFKNENDVIIKDPEGIEITKKFIEINKVEMLRLLDEYFLVIVAELDKDLDKFEYEYWAGQREEVIAIRSAVKKGNIPENADTYLAFKKSFLSALSQFLPR